MNRRLTENGRQALAGIASRHGVSPQAVEHVMMALQAGQGTLAQFNHPDLGGMGQWSQGGMTMIGDMFNNQLKAKVDAICADVAALMRESSDLQEPASSSSQSQHQGGAYPGFQSQNSGGHDAGVSLFVSGGPSGHWWPEVLGRAASTGSQNRMRYAWFPDSHRLAIDTGNGAVRVYDTGDHRIGGFSQQQGGDQSLSFTSQDGLVKVSELRQVDTESPISRNDETGNQNPMPSPLTREEQTAAQAEPATASIEMPKRSEPVVFPGNHAAAPKAAAPTDTVEEADIFAKIERLAALHVKGILTDEEYHAKKAELLARI